MSERATTHPLERPPLWPVFRCPSMAGFEVSTEVERPSSWVAISRTSQTGATARCHSRPRFVPRNAACSLISVGRPNRVRSRNLASFAQRPLSVASRRGTSQFLGRGSTDDQWVMSTTRPCPVTSLILREKRWTAGSSTFSVDAWFLSLFRHISGCFKSKMGAECALRQTRANASSSLSAHGCHRLLDPPS